MGSGRVQADLGGVGVVGEGPSETRHSSDAAGQAREVPRWALPRSVALTGGIPVGFFSSAK